MTNIPKTFKWIKENNFCVSEVLRISNWDTQPRSFRVGLKVSGTKSFGVSSGPRYISIKTIIMIARITAKSETNFLNHEGPNDDVKKNWNFENCWKFEFWESSLLIDFVSPWKQMIDREFQDIRTTKNNKRLEHMESDHIFQIDMRIRHQIKHRSL